MIYPLTGPVWENNTRFKCLTRAEVSLIDGKLISLIAAPPEGGDYLCARLEIQGTQSVAIEELHIFEYFHSWKLAAKDVLSTTC